MLKRPNLRKLYLPDVDYFICEADMSKADAMVVAWDADDAVLKNIFREGKNLHKENAIANFGEVTPTTYKLAKAGVHALNYHCSARTLAITLGITIKAATQFQDTWFLKHPAIPQWHDKVKAAMEYNRGYSNIFGYKFPVFHRRERSISEILGWIGQSTVAINCTHAMLAMEELESKGVQTLLQVHDSIVFQMHKDVYPDILSEVYTALHQVIPYPDPLIIPWEAKIAVPPYHTVGNSWGDVKPFSWNDPPMPP